MEIGKLRSRVGVYGLAWALFVASLLVPAPASFYPNGEHAASGLFVAGLATQLERGYVAAQVAPLRFLGLCLFVLGLFSNVVFLFTLGLRGCRKLPRSWAALLAATCAVNASLAFFFPVLLRLPAFWLWLAAFVAVTYALALPGPAIPPAPKRTGAIAAHLGTDGIPGILRAWLGVTLFWLGVTTLNYASARSRPTPPVQAAKIAPLTEYVTDSANLLPPGASQRLTAALEAFEKETSSQVAVAIYPKSPEPSIDDFTVRTAERSRLGLRGLDNGAVLFVFVAERVARLEVGYGLEGALPDAITHRILDEKLAPHFSRSEFAEGAEGAVAAVLDTARGEYRNDVRRGPLARAWRVAKAAVPRFLGGLWPFLRATPVDARLGIGFFGTLIGFGVASGVKNAGRLGYDSVRGAWNLAHGRALRDGLEPVQIEPIWDTLKVLVVVGLMVFAVVGVIAGGGAFGGAGASTRW